MPLSLAFDWLSAGAVFVPGIPFGNGAAAVLARTRIAAWERANGRRILFDPDSEDKRPYAGAPL